MDRHRLDSMPFLQWLAARECKYTSEERHDTNDIRTHLFLGKPDTAENRAGFVSTVPLGRASTPADIANACTYLASDEAGFITGVNLEVR
jgi:NAD(P)-dependent dehydrogenase (short-subunit alcohol dehydrogenase family)